ncbi:MAG TPA: hypothetical protein PK309_08300 [Bacillota bacterium]|nr:hypothetical protein [Bacillota bacterium]
MPTPVERYERLKAQADELERKISRAEGALEQTMQRLQSEYGCKTLGEAQRKLKQLKAEAEQSAAEFEQAADEFETKWSKVLEDQ